MPILIRSLIVLSVLLAEVAPAEAQPRAESRGLAQAAPRAEKPPQRQALRQVIESQRNPREPSVAERRLSDQERAELRQQLKLLAPGRDGGNRR